MDWPTLLVVSHRRRNPLTNEWLLVSPQRLTRPWNGAAETTPTAPVVTHDPACALCPGVVRSSGATNPAYEGVYLFDNDHPALAPLAVPVAKPDTTLAHERALFVAEPVRGRCEVLCFSHRHDVSVPALGVARLAEVLDRAAQCTIANASDGFACTQLFENRGAQMGASSPHPHGQLWAQAAPPTLLKRELHAFEEYVGVHQRCILCVLQDVEVRSAERVVYCDDEVIALVPYWAVWPFETLVFTRQHAADLPSMTVRQRQAMARGLMEVFTRYDGLFDVPMPLSWGVHQAPIGSAAAFHAHAHLYPPLLRSASVRKWMVGYEMLGESQRDLLPEQAAQRLRDVLAAGGSLHAP